MKFDAVALMRAEEQHKQIGNWENYPVYAISRDNLRKHGKSGTMYVVWDDDNALVCAYNGSWRRRGEVSTTGNVTEVRGFEEYKLPVVQSFTVENRRNYTFEKKKSEEEVKKKEPVSSSVDFNIDDYLRQVNQITVEDMLVGVRGREA